MLHDCRKQNVLTDLRHIPQPPKPQPMRMLDARYAHLVAIGNCWQKEIAAREVAARAYPGSTADSRYN